MEGLLCRTNKMDCCGSGQVTGGGTLGHWFFPNGTLVDSRSSNLDVGRTDFFFRNRFRSVVRLLRVGHPLETGLFRCEVPDASNINQSLYVNVGMHFMNNLPHVYMNHNSNVTTMNLVSMPQLLCFTYSECDSNSHNLNIPFSNHNNWYTVYCHQHECFTEQFINCLIPLYAGSTPSPTPFIPITISIISLGINTAGEAFNLQCSIMSSRSTSQVVPIITWLDSSSQLIVSTGDDTKTISATMMNPNGGYFSTLSFNPLLESDAGLYVCRVMVGSIIMVETITINVNGMWIPCHLRV